MLSAEQIKRLCDAAILYKDAPQSESRNGWQPLGFTMEVDDDIKDAILQELGLDLSAVRNVPFRWITGDTEVHTDCTTTSFANTYMIYLTDCSGEFIVSGKSHAIKQGAAFVFPAGTAHETRGTGSTPRLVLGPMSEAGVPVAVVPVDPTWEPWIFVSAGVYTSTYSAGPIATITQLTDGSWELTSIANSLLKDPWTLDIGLLSAASGDESIITSIGANAAATCNIQTLILTGITSIGYNAFSNNDPLATVYLPPTLTIIRDLAFSNISTAFTIILPASLTIFGESVEYGSSPLHNSTNVTIIFLCPYSAIGCIDIISGDIIMPPFYYDPSQPGWRGSGNETRGTSLYDANGLASLSLVPQAYRFAYGPVQFYPAFGMSWSSGTPTGDNNYEYTLSNTDTVKVSVQNGTIMAATQASIPVILTSPIAIDIGAINLVSEGRIVTEIGSSVFQFATGLYSIIIPSTVTTINESAFSGATNLQSVVIPASVLSIEADVFTDCTNTIAVFLCPNSSPDLTGLTSENLFYDPAAYSVAFPTSSWPTGAISLLTATETPPPILYNVAAQYRASYGSVQYYSAFGMNWVSSVSQAIYILSNSPVQAAVGPVVRGKNGGGLTLLFINDNAANNTPVALDISAMNQVSGNTIIDIGADACADYIGLYTVSIPDTVTTIQDRAFNNCPNLQSIVIPASVNSFPSTDTVFLGCTNATAIFLCDNSSNALFNLSDLSSNNIWYDASNNASGGWTYNPLPTTGPVLSLVPLQYAYQVANGPARYNAAFNIATICYGKGSLILTMRGYVAIENILQDDMILTHGSILNQHYRPKFEYKPVVWKGHFSIKGLDNNSKPICIKAHAMGKNIPTQDLYLSPGHRVLVDGEMVQARDLVNGRSIIRDDACDEITYYHIEVEGHCAIVANGLVAESYMDVNNRKFFNLTSRK